MDGGVPGQSCGDELPAVSFPGTADSGLQARFTQPPLVVHLAGDIDEWTYRTLTEVLAMAAATGWDPIQLDLAGVGYCDVAGLRAILSLAGSPGEGGRENGEAAVGHIVLARLPPPLRSVLGILGWDTVPGVILEDCPS